MWEGKQVQIAWHRHLQRFESQLDACRQVNYVSWEIVSWENSPSPWTTWAVWKWMCEGSSCLVSWVFDLIARNFPRGSWDALTERNEHLVMMNQNLEEDKVSPPLRECGGMTWWEWKTSNFTVQWTSFRESSHTLLWCPSTDLSWYTCFDASRVGLRGQHTPTL